MAVVTSAPDPYALKDIVGPPLAIVTGANGYTQASSIIAAPSTTKTIIIGGQSNMGNSLGDGTFYTVTNPTAVHMLNIYDGGFYNTQDRILGCSSTPQPAPLLSNMAGPLGDDIINRAKATRVITCSIALGGTPYVAWEPGNAADYFARLRVAILRFRARGLEPDFIIWGQGETDAGIGTSAASVKASIWAMVDEIRAAPISCNAPFYVGLYTLSGGVINTTIRSGISSSVDAGRIIRLGYDADSNATVAGGYRQDGTHLSNSGRNLVGAGWGSLILP